MNGFDLLIVLAVGVLAAFWGYQIGRISAEEEYVAEEADRLDAIRREYGGL